MAAETEKEPQTIAPPETEVVSAWRVCCDGSGPGLGHPRVWLSIPHDTGFVECGYCDKRFVHESFADKVG
ncbi:putative Zn-finger protein [Rhodovulum bhavnagarense]|uniref:Putative Zn-finger protein n=1 Tax=Rhodovulum bhavnagarense TaxID=992286 RepID=A0A4R2RIG7_9RHOB|nr:zinc-finger domain-containing protein [Rhodovulum bhavnagarense]TCP62813.1 putative Zn-finger protein [Rhodovulum bhavnagarense]